MRILITGAAGFLGSHLAERFLKEGYEVAGLDNFITGSRANADFLAGLGTFELIEHDISNPIDIAGDLDGVLHFASPASPVDYLELPIQTLKVGSLGTHNALGLALAVGGLGIGPLRISGESIWIPILIIGIVYTPYVTRPLRGQVMALREKEFVEAAVSQGAGPLRVMFAELLPNLLSTIIVFFAISVANTMLLESMLSFLGVGVQPPNTSWGTMIADGFELITSAPLLTVIPGAMLLLTVLAVNVFADGLRDALDPRAKLRLEAHAGKAEPEGTAV